MQHTADPPKAGALQTWDEVRHWRRATRAKLLAERAAVPRAHRQRARTIIGNALRERFPQLRTAVIGFYWPIKGEIDVNSLVRELLTLGATAALPVVVEKQRPLEFWRWQPQAKLARGFWNIPIPAERDVLQPDALIVPLLGSDSAGYRLGYGGGYYDRTLAGMQTKPLTIGVGYALGCLDTIHPQAHDIPLDAIVTESAFTIHRNRGIPVNDDSREAGTGHGYASPACLLHERDPE